jgi:hypothetical protein
MVRTIGPISIVARGSPGRVKTSGRAARTKGRAKKEDLASRRGPRRARVDSAARPSHATPRAANDPTGSRLIEMMDPTVRRNLRRASRRWTTLSRAR